MTSPLSPSTYLSTPSTPPIDFPLTTVCISTRIHTHPITSLTPLTDWITQNLIHADTLLIVYDTSIPSIQQAIESLIASNSYPVDSTTHRGVHFVPLQSWGKFVPALNLIYSFTRNKLTHCKYVIYSSIEMQVSTIITGVLYKAILYNADTNGKSPLGVGIHLQGMEFDYYDDDTKDNEWVPLTGTTAPWNTYCIWNMDKLSRTDGFLPVSEGGVYQEKSVDNGVEKANNVEYEGGIEEVAMGAYHQHHYGIDVSELWVVKFDPWDTAWYTWGTEWDNEERRKWHKKKMESKKKRADMQLKVLGLDENRGKCRFVVVQLKDTPEKHNTSGAHEQKTM